MLSDVVLFCKEGIVVIGVYLRRLCLSMKVGWAYACSESGHGTASCSSECCYRVMYGEWYGVGDFVVFSVVEMC